jgi:15-cis-phytoene desaturase
LELLSMRRRSVLRALSAGAASAVVGCGSPDLDPQRTASGESPRRSPLGKHSSALVRAPQACVESGRVIVLGGGVSGMSAAHELAERGFEVSVYELRGTPGGKARSIEKAGTGTDGRRDLPGEHGFRFFPGFYRHLPDTMRRIPYGDAGLSVHDNLVPATRLLLSQVGMPDVELPVMQRNLGDLWSALQFAFGPNVTNLPLGDVLFFWSKLERWLKSCDRRRYEEYESQSFWEYVEGDSRSEGYRKFLAGGLTRTLVAARAEHMSARSALSVIAQLLQDLLAAQGADRVLNGPTNDVWMDPWLAHLRRRGVRYFTDAKVEAFELERDRVRAVHVTRDGVPCEVRGELFVSALPADVIRRLVSSDMLAIDPRLEGLAHLDTAWMNGIQYFLDTDIPLVHGHATFFDSPWALTAVSQAQFWPDVELADYGDGSVRGILSVDISDWETDGILFGKPARACTAREIEQEVWAQLEQHWDARVGEAFRSARVIDVHLDPAIVFDASGHVLDNREPLLINSVGSWYERPEAVTALPNFFLAGDYVRTHTDLATMEAANESARHAVNGILRATRSRRERCAIWPLKEPGLYQGARLIDQFRYALGLQPL